MSFIVLLPWQTRPFESKGRIIVDDPLARDKVTAGSPGGCFSNKEQRLQCKMEINSGCAVSTSCMLSHNVF